MTTLDASPADPAGLTLPGVPVTAGVIHVGTRMSPRPAATAPRPAPHLTMVSTSAPVTDHRHTARHAATLTAYQYDLALSHMFRLEPFAADLSLIADVRRNHPVQLAQATAITTKILGAPKVFGAHAMDRFYDSPAARHATRAPIVARTLWWTMLALLPMAAGTAAFLLTADTGLAAAASAIIGFIFLGAFRIPAATGAPSVKGSDWKHLHADVVDATLADLLNTDGYTDRDTLDALRRSWEHLTFISQIGNAMSTPVFGLRMVTSETRIPATLPQAA